MSEGPWELLTRNEVNKEHVTSDALKRYKKILLLTDTQLEVYQPGISLISTEGKSSAKTSPPFAREPKPEVSDRCYAVHGKNSKLSAKAFYYIPAKPSAYSSLNKPSAALSRKTKSDVRAWLLQQEAYTMHKPVTKPFVRNPYTV